MKVYRVDVGRIYNEPRMGIWYYSTRFAAEQLLKDKGYSLNCRLHRFVTPDTWYNENEEKYAVVVEINVIE